MRERWPFLDVMVTDQPKSTTLGEYSGFVVDRAVPKAKAETGYYLTSTDDLDEVADGKRFALHRAQCKKSVDRSLHMAHGYWFSWQEAGLEEHAPGEQANKRPQAKVGDRTDDDSPCD